MIPYSIISFYTDFANKNPEPSQVTANFQGKDYNAIEGKRTFEQYQCMGCHSIVGNGAYFGPDLTNVYKRINGNDAALAAYLLSGIPVKGMPPMRERGMREEDAYRTVAFLKYTQMLDTNEWPNNGSWDRDGNVDSVQAKQISPSGIWQIILGIVFFNLLIFGIIIAFEREKGKNMIEYPSTSRTGKYFITAILLFIFQMILCLIMSFDFVLRGTLNAPHLIS